jgi:UrcA family protein
MHHSNRSVAHIFAVAAFAILMLSPAKFVRAGARNAEPPSIALKYFSTDLGTAQGVGLLYRRIRAAASTLCGPYDSALLEEKALRDKCVDQAVAAAVTNVHSERLSAHHLRHTRGKRPWLDTPTSLAVR